MLLLLSAFAVADPGPFDVRVDGVVPWTVAERDHDALLEEASGLAPDDATEVVVWGTGPDGVERPLADYLPAIPPVPDKEEERRGGPHPADLPGSSQGFLSGKATYLSQCHGFIWFDSLGRFSTQRPVLFETVEDFHNPEGMNQYLTAYLENAGAKVFTTKERDMQTAMSIVDDTDVDYSETGTGFVDGGYGWQDAAPWDFGDNPFRAGSVRRFPADANNRATWEPDVPEDGFYAVYVSWKSEPDNSPNAKYIINHPGGTIERFYDQTRHGSTWQYVDTVWLPAGSGDLSVALTVDETEAGNMLTADAVRIGGGMGDVRRFSVTSGEPRWSEGAILYTQYNGAPTNIYDPYGSGDGSDPSSRSRWADWEHPSGEDAVYLSWHSNAGGGTGTSTYTWLADQTPEAAGTTAFGDAVHDEIVNAVRALWDGDWTDRGRRTAHFSEINPNHNDEMPSALVELAFHDLESDTALLKHPEFRRDASRAMYRGIARYFADKDGTTPVFLPEPPVDVAVRHDRNGRLEVSWASGPVGDPFGDVPVGYSVYTSPDGRSWDNGTELITGNTTQLPTPAGETVYVRVVAVNDGGRSFPSEVVGASRSGNGQSPIVIVAAFDRMDVGMLVPTSTLVGTVKRMDLRHMNAYDTTVAHGQAIAGVGWPFETVSEEVFDSYDLAETRIVVWNAGEESTVDESFSTAQQDKISDFVEGGGTIWASGAEILWDLDNRGSDDDRAFAANVLGATMDNDASGSYDVTGEGVLSGVGAMDFAFSDGAPYPVEWPDSLVSSRPVVARYGNGQVAGVLGDGAFLLGYPFESIADPEVRVEVARAVLEELAPDYEIPDIVVDDTGDVGDDTGLVSAGGWVRHPKEGIRGCGCSGGAGGLGSMLALLLVLPALRRRR